MKRDCKHTVSDIRMGNSANDADCKFPSGPVVAVGDGWFEVRWMRGGVTYTKRHHQDVLDSGKLIVW